ncbi:unnamed protein product [Mytilus edulis]|uniref:Uncharacterized protein n=1 Tax=Mytilus edulis TaxID=6550 RepID=A0A8S3RR68_MYTED|nr:unnamed protein product [Mytilus edulis]
MEAPIETFIKDFVWARTGETVYTDLSTPSVVLLRDVKTCGSTALAALWLNILQHPNNYPVQRYPYRKLYQTNGTYKVVLTVDDVTLTVSMSLGSLKMKGEFILHWFQSNFLKVLDAYGRPWANPQPLDDKYSKLRKTWENLPSVKHSAVVVIENKTEVRESREEAVTEYKEETNSENKEADTTEEKVVENPPEENDDLMDLKEALQNVNKERGSDEDIMKQIASLSTGCVQHGPEYIYILWKSLLEQWFKDADNRVYIVTPQLDVDRLKDVVQLVLDQRLTANLEALYVHQKCDLIQNIGDVKATVQKQYPSKDQVFIEYKIYSNIIYPLAEFQCKFIACIKKGKVTVLQTSANFHADHFVKESVDTVSFHRMSKDEFHQRFLKPILASQFLQVSEK